MKKLVITVQTEGASAAERGVVFRHLEKLGAMGDFGQKKHERCATGPDTIVWGDGGVMQSSAAPEELAITVEGPAGSGKTILANYIQNALNTRGIATGDPVQSTYSDKIIIGDGQFMDIQALDKPRVETIQAMEMRISCPEFNASVELAAMASTLLAMEPYVEVPEAALAIARKVMAGLSVDQLDMTCDADAVGFPEVGEPI